MLARNTGFGPDWEGSPVNWASVFQEASNLLPPDDPGPPPPNQPKFEMGSQSSQHFIKRPMAIVTATGSASIDTGLESNVWKFLEQNLNETPKRASYEEVSRSFLCFCCPVLFYFVYYLFRQTT